MGGCRLRINLIEACNDADTGSIGAFYVKTHAEKTGHIVEMNRYTKLGYDIEMISLHHCSDFLRLLKLPQKAPIRLIGGHPMQNNPLPIIKYGDAVFVGEAENSIGESLDRIERDGIDGLKNQAGWIISKNWKKGMDLPEVVICNPLPENPPYLNRPGTRSAAWYVEIARGCPFKCHYCELGYSSKFRIYKKDHLIEVLKRCDLSKTRKINFYAPDEASYPAYKELYEYLKTEGYMAAFSSMRLESVMKNKPPIAKNMLIRIGIDGLTESTRARVNKKITNSMILNYYRMLIDAGHVQFKQFMIFGYPWEKISDFDEFEYLMQGIFRIPLKKNVSLRIKWTPFIPQPCTPLGKEDAIYDYDMVDRINTWHALNKRPRYEPGWFVENDGLMMEKSHRLQCELTKGDEDVLDKYKK
jgi:radical SAM superfamily enzyme YgiQ (UPF0313 family)